MPATTYRLEAERKTPRFADFSLSVASMQRGIVGGLGIMGYGLGPGFRCFRSFEFA